MSNRTGVQRLATVVRWLSLFWIAVGLGVMVTVALDFPEGVIRHWALAALRVAAIFGFPGAAGLVLAYMIGEFDKRSRERT